MRIFFGSRLLMGLFFAAFVGVVGFPLMVLVLLKQQRDAVEKAAQLEKQRLEFLASNAALFRDTQSALRARDEFLNIVSHELRTPLTSLKIQIQNLNRSIEKGGEFISPDRLRRMADISDRMVQRLAQLIEDLLDMSRLNAGKLALRYENFDFTALVHQVVEKLRPEIHPAGCEVKFIGPPSLNGRWDRDRMGRVVSSLLSNAIKYGRGCPIEVRLENQGSLVRLSVADRGIGIASQDQARIFKRFERASSSTHYGGLGLGLFIVAEILNLHRGAVHVESELGHGATFVVEVPIWPSADQELHALSCALSPNRAEQAS